MRHHFMDTEDLLALAHERVRRSLTLQECRKYLDAEILRGLTQCERVL